MVRRSLRSVRHARLAALVGAAALAVLLYATRWREIGVRTEDGWLLSIGSGCVQFGHNAPRFQYARLGSVGGPYIMPSWRSDWTFAWRPFRAATHAGDENLLVVPLWHGAAALAGVGVWATGFLGGMRRARTGCCLCCGYDLTMVPVVDGTRRCPECGTVPMETA